MSPAAKHSPQEQEQLVLDAAASCINETSLLDFTMSAIAKKAGLSMGSVYKHVQSKEDVLIALATRVFQHQYELFSFVLSLSLTTPQRSIAVSLCDRDKTQLFTFDGELEILVTSEAVLQRASSSWLEKMITLEEETEKLFMQCFEYAESSGELKLGENREREIEQLQVGMWSLCVGYIQVAKQRYGRTIVGRSYQLPYPLAADAEIILCMQRLLNSYQWRQPLEQQDIEQVCELLEAKGYR